MCGRNGHGAEFVQRHHGYPEVVAALEHKHHAGAVLHAQGLEEGSGGVGQLFELTEGEAALLTGGVGPEQSLAVGLLGGPGVDHVVGEVEIFGDYEAEILPEVIVIGEIGAVGETFDHSCRNCT